MKTDRIIVITGIFCLGILAAFVVAGNPGDSISGESHTVPWHISADVVASPPYGCGDIPGSDIASKMLINRNENEDSLVVTGIMNGLHSNTPYSVYLSKGYPHNLKRWNITGSWKFQFLYDDLCSDHEMTITFQDQPNCEGGNYFEGSGRCLSGVNAGTLLKVTGSVNRLQNNVDFWVLNQGVPGTTHAVGNIGENGEMKGTWNGSVGRAGTWISTDGAATSFPVTSWWPGYSTNKPFFRFTTDNKGSGYWQVYINDNDYLSPGSQNLSVWISEGGRTVLVSDNFHMANRMVIEN